MKALQLHTLSNGLCPIDDLVGTDSLYDTIYASQAFPY